MTALDLLAMCAERGVTLAQAGKNIRVRGPRPARDELLAKIRELKPQLLAMLKRPALPGAGTTATTTEVATRQALPPDGPRERWAYDWRGRPVNVWGSNELEDNAVLFVVTKPRGVQ